jgi:hypothetical protein
MKRFFCFILAVSLVLSFIACSSSPSGSGPTKTPPWLNDMPKDDVYWGIGTALQSSTSLSMEAAEFRARQSIARQISTTAEGVANDFSRDAGAVGSQANASMFSTVARQLTAEKLVGSRPIKRWQGPDGTWWFLVEYRKSEAKALITSMLGNDEAAYSSFLAKQADEYLDYQLSKQQKPVVVSE